MRVVFLDIDGVTNSVTFLRELEKQCAALGDHRCTCFRHDQQIDRAAIERLNRLVHVTQAVIVISSAWRLLYDPPELHRILTDHGLRAVIVGETPDGPNDPEVIEVVGDADRISRGHEIDFWLKKHPQVESYVILDDGSDMLMHGHRLVQTDPETGLLDHHVEQAIRMLGVE